MIRHWLLFLGLLFVLPTHALTMLDDTGAGITLSAPAQRIISLSPSITENLFAIGAGKRIVGVSSHSDYPAEAKNIPIVADHQSINLELIAALKPDLIIAWQGGNSPAQLAALSQLNIPIYKQRIQTLPEIPLALMHLALLTHLERTAAPVIFEAYQKIALLQTAPKPHLSSFYQVWHIPLMTLNHSSWISDALARCGVTNIFADQAMAAPKVSIEAVLQANPDFIITATPQAVENTDLDIWRTWTNLSAIQYHGLLFTDADTMNRATLRTLDTSQQLCEKIANNRHLR